MLAILLTLELVLLYFDTYKEPLGRDVSKMTKIQTCCEDRADNRIDSAVMLSLSLSLAGSLLVLLAAKEAKSICTEEV